MQWKFTAKALKLVEGGFLWLPFPPIKFRVHHMRHPLKMQKQNEDRLLLTLFAFDCIFFFSFILWSHKVHIQRLSKTEIHSTLLVFVVFFFSLPRSVLMLQFGWICKRNFEYSLNLNIRQASLHALRALVLPATFVCAQFKMEAKGKHQKRLIKYKNGIIHTPEAQSALCFEIYTNTFALQYLFACAFDSTKVYKMLKFIKIKAGGGNVYWKSQKPKYEKFSLWFLSQNFVQHLNK